MGQTNNICYFEIVRHLASAGVLGFKIVGGKPRETGPCWAALNSTLYSGPMIKMEETI